MTKKSDRAVRPNETIGLVPRPGQSIVLNQRLLFAALLFISRQQGDIPQYQAFLSDIASIVGLDVNKNTSYFRSLLDGLRELSFQVAIENMEGGQVVQDDHTIGYIDRPGFRRRHGVATRVLWGLDPEIKKRLLNPQGNYTLVPLGVIAKLKSGPAVALAEICFQYRTNYAGGRVGTTGKRDLTEWYPLLLGHHVSATYQYKYFKRDILEKIIENVNQESPFTVQYVEHKVGRRVHQLEFLIASKKKALTEVDSENDEGPDEDEPGGSGEDDSDYLIARITKEIGTTHEDAALILAKYKDRHYVEKHINDQLKQQAMGFKPQSSVAVFKARLKNNYEVVSANAPEINTHLSQKPFEESSSAVAEDESLIEEFLELPNDEKENLLAQFLNDQTAFVQERYIKNQLENRIVRACLKDWLKKRKEVLQ